MSDVLVTAIAVVVILKVFEVTVEYVASYLDGHVNFTTGHIKLKTRLADFLWRLS